MRQGNLERRVRCAALLMAGAALACGRAPEAETNTPVACAAADARAVVQQLGERMQKVSLLAPDRVLLTALRAEYAPLVTRELLNEWLANPRRAPGREVSSPWPDRIEVDSVIAQGNDCQVIGRVIYATSSGPAQEVPVRIRVTPAQGAVRVAEYEAQKGERITDASSEEDPAAVITRYYVAINAGDLRAAYELWGQEGAASGKSFEDFAAGYAQTDTVTAVIGTPGPIEGAAGSRYVEIPVTIRATTKQGEQQQFAGKYTLRRSVVDGATPEQQQWRIYSASIARAR